LVYNERGKNTAFANKSTIRPTDGTKECGNRIPELTAPGRAPAGDPTTADGRRMSGI
jgi:hypothetical protein